MKKTVILLLLVSRALQAQVPNYNVPKSIVNQKVLPQKDQKKSSQALAEALLIVNDRIILVRGVSELQTYSGPATQLSTIDGRFWTYEASSNTPPNNGTVILASGKGKGRWVYKPKDTISVTDFGASPNDGTDDHVAIQQAINYASKNNFTLTIPDGLYKISSPLIKTESFLGINIRSAGNNTIFDYSSIKGSQACIKIIGGSGKICQASISGITFRGNRNTTGIEIAGQCGQTITHCNFETNFTGILFHNEATNTFSEWNTGSFCSFASSCRYAISYKRTKGNNSFHGSGLVGVNYINASGEAAVLIGEDCFPYNAPLNAQVWFKQNSAFIENNSKSAAVPYFNGNITFEHFGGNLTLATKNKVFFTGGIQALGDFVTSGLLYQCDALVINQNNSTTPYGLRWNGQIDIKSSSTVLSDLNGAIYQVALTIIGDNYDYRYILIIDSSGGNNGKGSVTILATTKEFNSIGYGKPTFNIDSFGRLTVTNPNYASSSKNLKAYITLRQIADYYYGNYPAKSF
ncbi:glycosyl hydrolase family 28-related protein [Fibrisoma limi]|nr:glycosyl hydrolase family 28-related protein [Fibrisoma limi]